MVTLRQPLYEGLQGDAVQLQPSLRVGAGELFGEQRRQRIAQAVLRLYHVDAVRQPRAGTQRRQ